MDENSRRQENPDLDREMERDTEIRRETQVRGSLGLPPTRGESRDDEAVPEFERPDDEDRTSDR